MPYKGRTSVSDKVVGGSGKSGNWPEDQGVHRERGLVVRGFRHNSLVLVQKIKPRA